MFLDSTERNHAEAQARERELQDSEARTELAHANRVATIGYLTASIVHDVRQPIAATVANALAALHFLDRPDVDEVREAPSRIVRDGARAGALVDRTLALAKKTPSAEDRVEINAAIRETIELIRTGAAKNGVSVQMEFVETLPPVQGDRVQLPQVVLNLVINPIEAMSETSEGRRAQRFPCRWTFWWGMRHFSWVCLTFRAKSASEEATFGLVAVRGLRDRTSRA